MAIRFLNNKSGGSWQVYWNNPVTTKRESKCFKVNDYKNKKSARFAAEEFDVSVKRQMEENPVSFASDIEDTGVITFRYLANAYLKDKLPKPLTSSWLNTLYVLRKYVYPHFENKEAASLRRKDMKELERKLRGYGLKQNTIHRYMKIPKAIMNWSYDQELIEVNPIAGYICERGVDEIIPPPSPEEAQKIIECADAHIQRALIISFSIGLRVGTSELFKLRWCDVDFTSGVLRIWSAKKNLKIPYRDIKLTDHLQMLFACWKVEDDVLEMNHDFIIHWGGKPITAKIRRAYLSAKEKAGITRRIRPYDFRHAFATEALRHKKDLKHVAKIMGHANVKMLLERYQHLIDELEQDVFSALPELSYHEFGN